MRVAEQGKVMAGALLVLLLLPASAWATAPGWKSCIRPVSQAAPTLTPYLADLSLAGELRKRRECLDAGASRRQQPGEEADVLLAREAAKQQHLAVMTRIFIRDRELLAQPPRVAENTWPRLVQGSSFDAQQRLVEMSGAQLVAASSPDAAARWGFWKADLAQDTTLYFFIAAAPGDAEARFAQIASTPATHAPLWVDSLQGRLDGTGAPRLVSASTCLFDLAATKDEFIYKNGQVLSVAEGERALVVLSGRGGTASLAAHLEQIRVQAPTALDRFDKLVALSKVPGPRSPACAALNDDTVTRTLGSPGMTRAQFRRLWHGLNGGIRALGGHDFDVSPEFKDERLNALEITPAMTFEANEASDASPKPNWQPRSHDEAEALLSRGLGQLAYRQSAKDTDGADLVRSVWRLGHGVYAVLSNRTAAGAPVSMTARMTKGLSETQERPREGQQKPWRLLVFHAFRPGILSLCENAHRWPNFERLALPDPADPLKARWLDEAASIQWQGGRFAQMEKINDVPAARRLLTDACFTLFIDGAPMISGAIVPTFSARRFEFPALVIERTPAGAPLVLTLAPSFPVQADRPLPATWRDLLTGLASTPETP